MATARRRSGMTSQRHNRTAPRWRDIANAKPCGDMKSKHRDVVTAGRYDSEKLQRCDSKML
jgi:hypothetical protein